MNIVIVVDTIVFSIFVCIYWLLLVCTACVANHEVYFKGAYGPGSLVKPMNILRLIIENSMLYSVMYIKLLLIYMC